MVKNTLFTTLALAVGAVVAVDPVTTQIFLAGFDTQSIVGSVIASDATATTFSVACANTADPKCVLPPSFTFTQGPSTVHYAYTHSAQSSGDFTGTIDVGCSITALAGTCTKSVNAFLGTLTSTATSSTTTFSGASEMAGQVLTITGGHLVVPTTAYPTSTSSSSSSASVKSTTSYSVKSKPSSSIVSYDFNSTSIASSSGTAITPGPVTTATGSYFTSGSAPTQTAGGVTSVSTGGMPMVTGSAKWVMGGAAAAMAALAAL